MQSWIDCWVKEGITANSGGKKKVIFFCRKNIGGQYSLTTEEHPSGHGLGLWFVFLHHLLGLNVSHDRAESTLRGLWARRGKTTMCRWSAVWFVSWDCSEIGGLMNPPRGAAQTLTMKCLSYLGPLISCVVFLPVALKYPCGCFDNNNNKKTNVRQVCIYCAGETRKARQEDTFILC